MKDFYTLNLQLFATTSHGVVNVTTDAGNAQGSTGTNDLSPENKTFYDKTLIRKATPNLVHDQFAQKRPIPKNGGKTIEFRAFGSLPTDLNALTEGVTPTGGTLSVTAMTATVAQYGYYIVQSDVLELTSIDNTITEAVMALGNQAGEFLDKVTRGVLKAGVTQVLYPATTVNNAKTYPTAASGTNGTTVLNVETIHRAVTWLKANNTPKINGDYVAIVHPHVMYDLMRDPEWIDAHKYAAPENLYTGEIGKIAGVRFCETSVATGEQVTTGFGYVAANAQNNISEFKPTVYDTYIFGQGAYGTTEIEGGGLQTIIKQKGSAGTADPLDQRSSIGWKAIKTGKVLVPEYIIRIPSVTTYQ